jgi:rubrerythrin
MSAVSDHLRTAFAGESQANRKYLAYAEKADKDGLPNLARLFRAAADAETVHAIRHWRTLGMIRSSAENLEDAIAGETYEVNQMYPTFLEAARAAGDKAAAHSFAGALETEKVHKALYEQARAAVAAGKDIEAAAGYHTCEVCGYTHVGSQPPERCPVCKALRDKFHPVA